MAPACPLLHPAIEAGSGFLEFNRASEVAVVVEDAAPRPMRGSVELSEEGEPGDLRIEPAADPAFAGLAPGAKLTAPPGAKPSPCTVLARLSLATGAQLETSVQLQPVK